MQTKILKRIITLILTLIISATVIPLAAFAAPAADIPKEMLDNVYLDALGYTGYNVSQQKEDGSIFLKISNATPKNILSGIKYNTVCTGLETVSQTGTITGKAPDIAKFKSSGLCCATYISYVYYNYLPNIAGIDTSGMPCPSNPKAAVAYNTAAKQWISSGKAKNIAFTQNANGTNFIPSEKIPIGSLIIFKRISDGAIRHVALYAGEYKNKHYITHVGSDNGPEICTIEGLTKGGMPEAVYQVVVPEFTNPNGSIEVYKKDTNGNNLAGAYFEAVDSKDSSMKYTIGPTNASGYASSKDKIPFGTYKVRETVFPKGYTSSGQTEWTVTVSAANNGTATFTAVNTEKKFRLSVKKEDSEKSVSQGNAELSGAVYGLFKGGVKKADYTTDKDGSFTTDWYACGEDWTLKEISPGKGYMLDSKVYSIGAAEGNFNIELNNLSLTVKEQVKKGYVSIIKHFGDGSTGVEKPEYGAEFQVYLKSAGRYNDAKEYEKDILVCNKNGYAKSKELPYGVYTVHQTKGDPGHQKIKDFDVFIEDNGETYQYILNDGDIKSDIKIVKKDSETGKVIAVSGIGFKIKNVESGKYITQHINYPSGMDIDVFYTDNTGTVMLPEKLPFGDYELNEVKSAAGYVLDTNPVPFKVDGSMQLVTVEKKNTPQKGKIEIIKTGEVFSSVNDDNGIYTPVYTQYGLKGAKFEIFAAEDITTSDGTVRIKKGETAATIITDQSGRAESSELYLGKYSVQEIEAPFGMVLDSKPVEVILKADDQTVSVTTESVAVSDKRQKASITLHKYLEQNEVFKLGKDYEKVSFGLYAREKLVAADGTFIPENGLIEKISVSTDGIAQFSTDIPVGAKLYVKEISTADGYKISDIEYNAEFIYSGQNTDTVDIKVNDGKDIVNEIEYGSIKGRKTDKNDRGLKGAQLGLFSPEDKDFKNAIITVVSSEDGYFEFKNVPIGKWVVKELKAPDGYIISDETVEVTVTAESEALDNTITIVNEKTPEEPESPRTGDDSNFLTLIILTILSACGVMFCVVKNKKIKYEEFN